jgi:hypothetical protein
MNWVLISLKTALFIVTAVKTSNRNAAYVSMRYELHISLSWTFEWVYIKFNFGELYENP